MGRNRRYLGRAESACFSGRRREHLWWAAYPLFGGDVEHTSWATNPPDMPRRSHDEVPGMLAYLPRRSHDEVPVVEDTRYTPITHYLLEGHYGVCMQCAMRSGYP